MPKLKLESLLLVVFFASVALLGYRKCSTSRAAYVDKNTTANTDYTVERPLRTDSLAGLEGDAPLRPQTHGYSAPPVPTSSTPPPPSSEPITSVPTMPKQKPITTETDGPPTKSTEIPTVQKRVVTPPSQAKTTTVVGTERPILYITIDRLKVRSEPGLKGKVLTRLKLHEKVYFLGERTDYKEEISLGLVMANEPWLKIETQGGKVGWVYGAGVDIMKTVREGVR